MKKTYSTLAILFLLSLFSGVASAEKFNIDTDGHAFIQFKIKHLGYSWLLGRFNKLDGEFNYDEKKPNESKITVNIDPASIDTGHAARDKHLRSKDFLHVKKFPKAKFVSTSFKENKNGKITLKGKLTMHGITKDITIDMQHIGHGPDPWGGYRRGFSGSTTLTLADYGITTDLGPASRAVEMFLSIEGIRKS